MSKVQTVTKTSHIFSLSNLKNDCYYNSVTADFTPPPSLNKASNSIVPAYLDDNNFFTPAFIVPRDKEYYLSTSAFEKEKFQARILKTNRFCLDNQGDEQKVGEITQPVPTTNYCQICKTNYISYQDHLKDASHYRQARFSKANKYISQLCNKYCKQKSKRSGESKSRRIGKNICQKNCKKYKRTRVKKCKSGVQEQGGLKNQNFSTNVPSLLPTPYC